MRARPRLGTSYPDRQGRRFLDRNECDEDTMPKNILVFSDGTGQAGGLTPDENRSNIYKMFRATRCGPDTNISAGEQIAFYDAGLGSQPPHGAFFVTRAWRWLHNVASQATGLGITTNIIDCYAWIVRVYEPGDRIYLFGFSRGAYTIRCLAAVLSLCGVPTRMPDGTPLRRDVCGSTAIAKEAVKQVYQFVSSPKDTAYVEQRKALAANFRQKYACDDNGAPNAVPFFIGVFDTVASLGSYPLSAALIAGAVAVLAAISFAQSFLLFPFLATLLTLAGISALAAAVGYTITHIKFAAGLPGHWWQRWHFASPKMKFYDNHLDTRVWYARHALSIDENRADFARVIWGGVHNTGPERPDEYPDWLDQVWFAGNHSDIGGSYPENEARLSDISLGWMVHAAVNLPDGKTPTGNGIKVDDRFLQLNPDPFGPQHDAREPGYFGGHFKWTEGHRKVEPCAILHSSVYKRFDAPGGVPQFYARAPYRPTNLSDHEKLAKYYPGAQAAPTNNGVVK
jgi:uncharacterized protein (DUF2235 family)